MSSQYPKPPLSRSETANAGLDGENGSSGRIMGRPAIRDRASSNGKIAIITGGDSGIRESRRDCLRA